MNSTQRDDRRPDGQADEHLEPVPGLELPVPNEQSQADIETLVDRVLVTLEADAVGAEYVSMNAWGVTRTRYLAASEKGSFLKRRYDERVGWVDGSCPRSAVQEELVSRLSRSTSLATNRTHSQRIDTPDTFRVQPLEDFRDS